MQYLQAKDPQETLDYSVDWTNELASGETIASSNWAVSPSGPTLSGAGTSGARAFVYMAGGTAGTEYLLTNTITTSASPARTHEKSIVVPVLQD